MILNVARVRSIVALSNGSKPGGGGRPSDISSSSALRAFTPSADRKIAVARRQCHGEPGIIEQRWINHRALPGDCLCIVGCTRVLRRDAAAITLLAARGRRGISEIARPNPETSARWYQHGHQAPNRQLSTPLAWTMRHQLALLSDGLEIFC